MRRGKRIPVRALVLVASGLLSATALTVPASADAARDGQKTGLPAGLEAAAAEGFSPVGMTPDGEVLEVPENDPTARSSAESVVPEGYEESEPFAGTGDIADAGPNVSFAPVRGEAPPAEGPTAQTVIGSDGRTQVKTTTSYPSRAIAWLNSSGTRCSGFLVSRNLLVTAGHCVHPGDTGSNSDFYSNFRASMGRNGVSAYPYGTCGWSQVWTDTAWIESGDDRFDYGFIRLDCNIGNTVGWFGWRWQSASWTGTYATVRGYPGDKPLGTMWTMGGSIVETEPFNLRYTIDTSNGQSGSPVYYNENVAIGIHEYGVNNTCGCNGARRITEGLSDIMRSLV